MFCKSKTKFELETFTEKKRILEFLRSPVKDLEDKIICQCLFLIKNLVYLHNQKQDLL